MTDAPPPPSPPGESPAADAPANPLQRFTSGGWLKGLARLLVGVVLVGVVLAFAGEGSWARLRDRAVLPTLAAGALIHLAQRAARIRKWQLLIHGTPLAQHGFPYLFRVQLMGLVANMLLPVSDALKVWAVSRTRRDFKLAAKSIAVEMSIHTLLIGVAGIAGGIAARSWDRAPWTATLVMSLVPVVVMAAARRFPREGPRRVADDSTAVWAWGVVETACQLAIYMAAFSALGVDVSPRRLLALAPVLYIVDLLAFTPAGLGLREALFAAVLAAMPNASAETGVAAGLLISSMLLLATLIGGGLALLLPDRLASQPTRTSRRTRRS